MAGFPMMRRNLFDPQNDEDQTDYFSPPTEVGPRMRNIFGKSQVDFNSPPTPPKSDNENYLDEIMRITNNRPAMSDYRDQLSQMPKMDDYKPSLAGKISAAMVGGATGFRDPSKGWETAQGMVQAPYRQAMGEFSNKLGIRKELAGLEEKNVDDQTKALQEARTMGLNYDKFKFDQKQKLDETGLKREEFANTKKKTEAEIAKMGESNYEYSDQADGSILAIDKNDPTKRMTIPAATVKAGQLGAERMNAQSSRISANAAAENASTNKANTESLKIYRDVMGKAATSRAANAATRLAKPPTPYQQSRAVDLALSLMQRDPVWSKYISKGGRDDSEPYLLKPDDGSPMYQQMKKQLKKQVEKSIQTGSPFPDTGTDNEDDDIIDLSGPRRK
jgi:hypothetical protein